jgi:hypothetical protein
MRGRERLAAGRGIYLQYTPDVPDIYLACTRPSSVWLSQSEMEPPQGGQVRPDWAASGDQIQVRPMIALAEALR